MKRFLFIEVSNSIAIGTIIASLAILSSCENKEDASLLLESEEVETNSHVISVERALLSLQDFLDASQEEKTRTVMNDRKISDVFAVEYKTLTTRAVSAPNLDCKDLVYVANFEDNQGFAVLAADDRIADEVMAVTSDGSLSRETIYSAMEDIFSNERPVVEDFPLTGEGFFTVDEYPDEIFMNPNTVSLYDEKLGDDLVGNFSLDNTGAEDENGNPILTRSLCKNPDDHPGRIVSSLCLSYAIDRIDSYGGGGGGSGSGSTKTETSTTAWSNVKVVAPILSKYVSWRQESPFNDLYPRRRRYLLFGHRKKAPAGCFPLAISKIMTHFEYPNSFTYNGYRVNWSALKNGYTSTTGAQSAAALLRAVSAGCDSWYFYAGTFTFPGKATSYMKFAGYDNARSYNYKYSRVVGMLDKGCPLIVYAIPGINIFRSHSWNIDGYKIKAREIITKKYVGGVLKEVINKPDTCEMVHCDFGWKGLCNGYYVSGIFKLNSSDVEFDNPYDKGKNTKYNTLVKIVTYDKPR